MNIAWLAQCVQKPIIFAVLLFILAPCLAQKNESISTPRTADDRPDLNGTWDNGNGADFILPKKLEGGSICVSGCGESRSGGLPPDRPKYKAQVQAKVTDLDARQVEEDPVLRCLPPGVPRIGPPDKIIQQKELVVFLYEDVTGNYFRLIPLNTKTYRDDIEETYLGSAFGYWQGETLVVESSKFTTNTWLTDDGSFHTDKLRVTERITRNGDTIEWQATAYDPEVLTEPWQLRPRIARLSDWEIAEAPPCIERDLQHMEDQSHHDNPR